MSSSVAIVTGATGFIGSRVVNMLLESGASVRAISSKPISKNRLTQTRSRIEWFSMTEEDIKEAIVGVTHFFNWSVLYDRTQYTDSQIYDVNVGLPLKIIKYLQAQATPVTCVIGDTFFRKFPIEATSQGRYTKSKQMLFNELTQQINSERIRTAFIQIEQVYGPGEALTKVIPAITQKMLLNNHQIALTTGNQRRDFIHVEDVVRAVMTVIRSNDWRGNQIIECGSGQSQSVRTVFEKLHEITKSKSILGFGDLPNDQTIEESKANITWLTQRGWHSKVSLSQGLESLVKDISARLKDTE